MKNRKIQEMLADAEHAILYATSLLRTVKEELKNSEAPTHAEEEEKPPTPVAEPIAPAPVKKEDVPICNDPKEHFYDPDDYLAQHFKYRAEACGKCPGGDCENCGNKEYSLYLKDAP